MRATLLLLTHAVLAVLVSDAYVEVVKEHINPRELVGLVGKKDCGGYGSEAVGRGMTGGTPSARFASQPPPTPSTRPAASSSSCPPSPSPAPTAQCNCGCSYPLRSYPLPPPIHYPISQPSHHHHPVMMPPPCYHQPQPPQIIVPIPPPPKGCSSARTTVQQQPMLPQLGHFPGFHSGPSQPPICVQSVYVGKKEDDDCESSKKKEKKKCSCSDEMRRRRRSRRQRRRYMDLRSLLDPCEDMDDPSDPSDNCDTSSRCDNLPCNSSPRIVYIDNQ